MPFLFSFLWATVLVLCLIVYRTLGNFSYLFVRALYILRSGLLGAGWHEISAPCLGSWVVKVVKPCCWRWAAHTRLTFWGPGRWELMGQAENHHRGVSLLARWGPWGRGSKGGKRPQCLQTDLGLHLFSGQTLPLLYHLFSKTWSRVLSPSASRQYKCEGWPVLYKLWL